MMSLFSLEEKGCFVALRPLELDVQATFCWFSSRGVGGDSHMKQTGMLVRNFEFNP